MIYLSLKFLHIAGAILFLGNIITGVFWKRTQTSRAIRE
jgi:uncharacterized membrane protein